MRTFYYIFIIFGLVSLINSSLAEETFVIKAKRIHSSNFDQELPIDNIGIENLTQDLGLSCYQSGSFSGVTSLRYRGLPSGSTKITFEGLDLKDSSSISNEFQLQHLASESIGKTDFFSGNFNPLYGSHSEGGVLNFSLARKNKASLLYGSQKTVNTHLNFFDKKNQKYIFSLNYFSSQGISQIDDPKKTELENDPSQKLQFASILKEKIGKTHLRIKFLGINHKFDVDDDYLGDIVSNDTSHYYQNTLGIDLKRGNLNFSTSYNNTQYNDSLQEQYIKGSNYKFDISYNSLNNHLLTGIDMESSQMEATPGKWNNPVKNRSLKNVGLYIKPKLKLNILEINPFIRVQHNELFKDSFIYGLSLIGKLKKTLLINFNYTKGFRIPTLYQLFSNYGSTKLQPEKTHSFESTLNWRKNAHLVSLSSHLITYKNQIAYNNKRSKYFNYSKSLYRGISAKYKFQKQHFGLQTQYDYTHAEDQNGSQLVRVPFHLINNSIFVRISKLKLQLSSLHKGNRTEFNGNQIAAYSLFNFMLQYSQSKKSFTTINLHNIFNQDYEEVENYKTRGRSIYAKHTILF